MARATVAAAADPTPPGDARRVAVDRLIDEVGASLAFATGGGALCRIEGTGGSAKYLEGRMAALLEARRVLRREPGADLCAQADRWRADLEDRRSRGSSPAWLDYLAGGVAECDRLMALPSGAPQEES